jgi:hypothetical protein
MIDIRGADGMGLGDDEHRINFPANFIIGLSLIPSAREFTSKRDRG